LSSCVCSSLLFDLTEELGSLRASIVDKCLYVFVEAVNGVLHFIVPLLGTLETSFKIKEFLVHSLVL
jgi:hypothetical protein